MHPSRAFLGAGLVAAMSLAATPALASPGATPSFDLSAAFAPRTDLRARALVVPRLQDEGDDQETSDDEPGLAVQEQSTGRNFDMELGFRGRYLTIPDSILDIWFTDKDVEGYLAPEERPQAHGYSVGIEFVVKSKVTEESAGGSNGVFYVQYIDSLMQPGLWDDQDSPNDFDDGDYIAPTDNFGVVALGANYAYELHMVKTINTNGNFGMSMVVGGGLGVGIIIGELEYWRPLGDTPSWERYPDREALEGVKRIPPALPMVDINLGFRFNFGDRFVMRLEGGFQNLLYLGGSVGLMF